MRLIALGNYPWQTKPVNCPQVNSYCSHWVNSHLIKFPLGKFPPGECIFTNIFCFCKWNLFSFIGSVHFCKLSHVSFILVFFHEEPIKEIFLWLK